MADQGSLLNGLFIPAIVAFVGKVAYDLRTEHQRRRAVAAALKGEVAAYVRLVRPAQLVAGLRDKARAPREKRVAWLKVFPALPTGHPVFDKVADRIGLVSPEAAQGVSEIYNVVTGLRVHLSNLSSAAFVDADDETQVERLEHIAELLEEELDRVDVTIAQLDVAARQGFWCFLLDCSSFRAGWRRTFTRSQKGGRHR